MWSGHKNFPHEKTTSAPSLSPLCADPGTVRVPSIIENLERGENIFQIWINHKILKIGRNHGKIMKFQNNHGKTMTTWNFVCFVHITIFFWYV